MTIVNGSVLPCLIVIVWMIFFSTIVSGTSLNGMENLKCNFTMWSDLCVRYWYRLFCDMLQTWPYKYSICLLINRVFQCLKDTSNENDIHQEKVKTEKKNTLFCVCAVIFRFCGLAQNVTFPSDPDGEKPTECTEAHMNQGKMCYHSVILEATLSWPGRVWSYLLSSGRHPRWFASLSDKASLWYFVTWGTQETI